MALRATIILRKNSPPFPSLFTISTPSLAHHLLHHFSRPPPLRDPAHLQTLASALTPDAVEAVLRDLQSWRSAHEFFLWVSLQPGFRHSCYTYNAMASILSRVRQPSLLRSLLHEILSRKCPMTPGALGFLIRCVGSQGLVDEAEFLFDHAEELSCVPNLYTYNCLIEVLAKVGRVRMVELRFREMKNPDKYSFTAMLQAYCNAGMLDHVWRVFKELHGRGWVDEHVFTILVVAFCRWGKVDKVFELVEAMEGLGMRLNVKTFRVLVHGFAKQGSVEKAVEMFKKMKLAGFDGDLRLYSVLIEGFCAAKAVENGLALYREMKNSGICPDNRLMKMMISSLCGAGDMANANSLLEEEGDKASLASLVSLYNTILDGMIRFGDVERAHLLLRSMMANRNSLVAQKDGDECESREFEGAVSESLFRIKKSVLPNDESFSIVLCGLCEGDKLDKALVLFDDMISNACKGNLLMHNNLINKLCSVGRLEESYNMLNKMRELGFVPTEFTNNSIFYCLCKRGDSSTAIDLLKEMRHQGHVPWIKYCTLMVQQLSKQGKVDEACSFLEEMVQIGFLPDMIAYSAAIDGMCRIGEMDKALKVFRDVSSSCYLPDVVAHNIVINGFCKAGRLADAEAILNEMIDKGIVPSTVTYNLMIDGWCKAGRMDKALACLSKMNDESEPPSVATYTSLIDGFCSVGRTEDALQLWNEMQEKGCLPNKIAYSALVYGLCKCGRADVALSYFHEMKERKFEADASLCILMVNCLLLKRNLVSATEFLKQVRPMVESITTDSKDYRLMRKAVYELSKDVISLDKKTPLIQSVSGVKEDNYN
ncbi:TPR-like protein [Dioscorea alata]|uniref:TPR-like protein n=1 Tax=Dioscorea alata TaxID=55571 RepID=A0ACB7WQ91_DIOAL|nr:TPR-like protein [Dioscorea alata]